jgi:uncharacterized membrane protein YfcA
MGIAETLGLLAAAAAGGAINAVAGGGTLVTFPTLLAFGTPPVIANATSTLALVIGTSGGIYGFRQHLAAIKPWLWRFVPVSVLGGLLGSILLTLTSNSTFSKLVPFLILFATVLFLAQSFLRRFTQTHLIANPTSPRSTIGSDAARHPGEPQPADDTPRLPPKRVIWGAIAFQFAVAVYGGYFGAGIGILMLASLGLIGLRHIHEMNALKTILGSLINLVAAIWFILAGLIHWPKAGVMVVGAVAGYFLGSHFSQRISQRSVRLIITLIGLTLSAWTFYQQFLH